MVLIYCNNQGDNFMLHKMFVYKMPGPSVRKCTKTNMQNEGEKEEDNPGLAVGQSFASVVVLLMFIRWGNYDMGKKL